MSDLWYDVPKEEERGPYDAFKELEKRKTKRDKQNKIERGGHLLAPEKNNSGMQISNARQIVIQINNFI